ncbi:MAG: response regulator [Arthrospira sp. PLM2.Bin9]|nr:response regulator [Arthrospira sp. PLM2.Bin9]TVU53865.1 MAG: response regulator [Arthrospira sp. PLM2.Bin9]
MMRLPKMWSIRRRLITGISSKISLRGLLVIPFVVQIFATVGVVGYLSFRNGQKAVDDLAYRLIVEIVTRIEENITHYLEIPFIVGRDIQDTVALGLLDVEDLSGWELYFWRKANFFESIDIISLGNKQGEYRSTSRTKDGQLQIGIAGASTNFDLYRYNSLEAINRQPPDYIDPDYDPRERPWYRVAIGTDQPVWSQIYTRFEPPPILQISASQIISSSPDSTEADGVMSIVISLSYIGQVLNSLDIGETGKAFIIDHEGLLVASSTSEPLFKQEEDRIIRQAALVSTNPLIQEISQYLKDEFDRFDRIDNSYFRKIPFNGETQYIKLLPFRDERGLRWLIVVVIPEADFMHNIQNNTRLTMGLSVIALAVAIAIGWMTGEWITRPIIDLAKAANALSRGDWNQKVGNSCTQELRTLARSFKQMRGQLKLSYSQLQEYSYRLEQKVAERTQQLEQKVKIAEAAVRERKAAEAALRESEQKFSTAFHAAPNPITISRLDDGIHLEVNESFCLVTGYNSEEIINRTLDELNLWVYSEQRSEMLDIIAQNRQVRNFELEFRTKNGEIRSGLISADIINLNSQECLLTSSNDITDRRRTEEALRRQFERERLLRQITEELRSSLDSQQIFQTAANRIGQTFAVDRCTIYTYLSSPTPQIKAVAEYLKCEYPPILNQQYSLENYPYIDRILSQDVAITTEDINRDNNLQGALEFCQQFEIKSLLAIRTSYHSEPNGAIYLSQCSNSRTWTDEEIDLLESVAAKMGIALAQANLLEREKQQRLKLATQNIALEEARRAADAANRAKSTFLANMSHELRTPLNAILGFSQLMADNPIFAEGSQELAIINRSGEHLLELINDILDLSKIEAGKITLEIHPFDLHRLLETLEEMFKLKAANQDIILTINRPIYLPRYVLGDEKKLRQVLINLLANAIKFTIAGEVTLYTKTLPTPKDAETDSNTVLMQFMVEDTGPGISSEEIDALFDAFVQTEIGRYSQEGTGLGLPISRKFVQLMGGDITVDSTRGVGSKFSFEIPLDLATAQPLTITPLSSRKIAIESDGQNYRILVVDEVPENRLLVARIIEPLGFQVLEAENGREAIATWETHKPQLIWMDMRMPIMDGYEATRQIRSRPCGDQVKIIALTASALSEQEVDIIDAGCDDILRKPFQNPDLLEKMAIHLGLRYRYLMEANPPSAASQSLRPLTPQALMVMPFDWLKRLHNAAISGDDAEVFQLITQIPESETELVATLTELVNNFRLDTINDVTQTLI